MQIQRLTINPYPTLRSRSGWGTRQLMVKVRFSDQSGGNTETLWAIPVDGNLYQLDNSPFLAYGVSWQDIIETRVSSDQALEYVRCVKKSGNRTIRVIF